MCVLNLWSVSRESVGGVFYDAFGQGLNIYVGVVVVVVYMAGFSVDGLLRSVNAVPMCRIYELNYLFYDCSSFDSPAAPPACLPA